MSICFLYTDVLFCLIRFASVVELRLMGMALVEQVLV